MKIALVTNILTPYRMRFYTELSNQLQNIGGELKVFVMTSQLPLRPWTYEGLKSDFTELLPGKKIMIKGQDILFNGSISRKIKEFNPSVVILAGSWTYPTAWKMMLNKNEGTRYYFWTESHNVRATPQASKGGLVFAAKKKFYNLFDGFCAPGKYAMDTIDGIVGGYGRRVRLPNLVDDEYYKEANIMRSKKDQIKSEYGIPEDKLLFVTPARLIQIKGMNTFLRKIVNNPYVKSAVFILAGEGELETELKSIAQEYGIDIRLMGYCNQDTIRKLYAAADYFLLPSLQDANPLTAIEAAFAGLPLCVSHYVGNSPELVSDKANGVVFDTVDDISVNEAFNFLMQVSSEWRHEAGKKSLKIASENFVCKVETHHLIEQLSE